MGNRRPEVVLFTDEGCTAQGLARLDNQASLFSALNPKVDNVGVGELLLANDTDTKERRSA